MSLTKIVSMLTGLAVVAGLTLGTSAAFAGNVLQTGNFKGAGGHRSAGKVQIIKDGGVTKIVFNKNFRLNSAPDPRIAFGNGRYVRGTIFTKLKKLRGAQAYVVPARIDPTKFSQVWLWCKKFDAPLGVANLKKSGA